MAPPVPPMPEPAKSRHARDFLGAVFKRPLSDGEIAHVLAKRPELDWLAMCVEVCPLPAEYVRSESIGLGATTYLNVRTGKPSHSPPMMPHFVRLASLLLQWREGPDSAAEVSKCLAAVCKKLAALAAREKAAWGGPHLDPNSGEKFWFCQATGHSTWNDPVLAAEFLSRVARRLQYAILDAMSSTEAEPRSNLRASSRRLSKSVPRKSVTAGRVRHRSRRAKSMPAGQVGLSPIFEQGSAQKGRRRDQLKQATPTDVEVCLDGEASPDGLSPIPRQLSFADDSRVSLMSHWAIGGA